MISNAVESSARSLMPLKEACRSFRSSVQARYSTSATSSGSVKTAFFRLRLTGWGCRRNTFKQLPQLLRKILGPAGTAAANIDELVILPGGEE